MAAGSSAGSGRAGMLAACTPASAGAKTRAGSTATSADEDALPDHPPTCAGTEKLAPGAAMAADAQAAAGCDASSSGSLVLAGAAARSASAQTLSGCSAGCAGAGVSRWQRCQVRHGRNAARHRPGDGRVPPGCWVQLQCRPHRVVIQLGLQVGWQGLIR